MKRILLSILFLTFCYLTYAQVGLEGIIVEKYYKSDANDAAGSVGTLPVGSVTYRIFVNMKKDWEFQMGYGSPEFPLKFSTTTGFFNNEDRGAIVPSYTKTQARANTVMLDSWFSVGAACAGNFGVLKTMDDGVNTVVNQNGLLQNNDPSCGIPLTVQDGLLAGTPKAVTFVGGEPEVFNNVSNYDSVWYADNWAWASLDGSKGPDTNNIVLIGQFTTDGIFKFQFSIQLRSPDGNTIEKYVYAAPQGPNEYYYPALKGTYGAPNQLPNVSIIVPTADTTCITGDVITLTATASDPDGSIASVQFFRNGTTPIGAPITTPPFTTNWTTVAGTHSITARAIDNEGGQRTSTARIVTVNNNQAPTVSITSPAGGSVFNVGQDVVIQATAADADGSITKVEFYVNAVKVGEATTAPYEYTWTAVEGPAALRARATDNRSASTQSAIVNINVVDPAGGPYSIIPANRYGSCANDLFEITVQRIKDSLVNCTGFDAVMTFDKNKVIPTGLVKIHKQLITDSLLSSYYVDIKDTSIDITIYLNSSAPAGIYFRGIGDIFSVEFSKLAAFQAVDTVEFTVPRITASFPTSTVLRTDCKPGKYISYKDTIFTGQLKFWSNNSPLGFNGTNLVTNIIGNINPSITVQPNTHGIFQYNINNGDSIRIERDINNDTAVMPVINGFDQYLTQKVLVNDPNFTPSVFQIIAMDVNMDGKVSAGDLSQIMQRTVSTIGEYTQKWNYGTSNPSKDWLYVDLALLQSDVNYRKSTTFPEDDGFGYSKHRVPQVPLLHNLGIVDYGTCPVISGKTFKGVLLGDVNGSFASVNPSNMKGDADAVVFDLSKATKSANYIDVPVYVKSEATINSLDFSMNINNNDVSFISVIDNNNTLDMLSNMKNNTLYFTSYSLKNYNTNPVVVRFYSNTGEISSNDFSRVNAYLNGDAAEIKFSATNVNTVANDYSINVYPNPASTFVNVDVSENSTVQLLDITGKNMLIEMQVNANEKTQLNVESLSDGIYFVKVINPHFSSIKQIVIIK